MNKKKKAILFSVLSVVLVAAISLSIVFLKPFRSQPDSSTSSEASQSTGSGNKVGSLNGVSYSEKRRDAGIFLWALTDSGNRG